MNYRVLLALMLMSAVVTEGQGQVPGQAAQSEENQTQPGSGQPATPGPSPADQAATAVSVMGFFGGTRASGPLLAVSTVHVRAKLASAPPSPRHQRLAKLQFDRRPSTVLKVWGQQAQAKGDKSKTPAKPPLDRELETFERQVTLGDWPAVKAYLAKLPANEGKAAYKRLLQSLQTGPQNMPNQMAGPPGQMIMGPDGNMMPQRRPELNAFTAEDVIGLAAAAPGSLDKELTASLGAILRLALEGHTVVSDVVARLKTESDKGKGKSALTQRQAAQILMAADEAGAAGTFLPPFEKANADKDAEGLNLLARHFLGLHSSVKKVVYLDRAWSATQAVLALNASKPVDKEEALRRAVELAPKIKADLGQAWLDGSFTKTPERGMEILATIGALAAQGLDTHPQEREERLKTLRLQKTALEALLKAAPQLAIQWHNTLTLLAGIWMREAEYTRQMDNSGMGGARGGPWAGNPNSVGDPEMFLRQQNMPLPIHTADLLRTRPEGGWIRQLDAGPRAKLAALLAHLYLKDGDEKKAFPFIEELGPANKEGVRELVNEFLRVWTAGHDPNAARQENDAMMYNFGWFSNATGALGEGIPLTRSKQERNLTDLAGWVERMRRLPLDRLDEDLLIEAFTKCHSRAEVYRLEAIEKIFGPLPKIKPRTLATLVQTTRANLAGVWRSPAEQQKQKTNRKQKDIEKEVLRGYELAGKVVDDALKQFPDDWSLHLARAALLHDEVNYRQEIARNSDFSKNRSEAVANYQKAAALYADQVKTLAEDEETTAVYQQWFNVSLGATDLEQVDDEKQTDFRQAPLIRKALLALPGQAAGRHLDKMAKALVANLSVVKPPARFRYLKQGFAVIGDNPHAAKAHQVFDFYKDLVNEIKLDVVIDGSDNVGHKQAFGIFVNLRHTREIERESDGFGRFLQNQTSSGISYNFGRPPTDYRDRFQAAASEALKEQFEILSFTFQTDKVHSRAAQEYGWRVTPYAYLLLKPRGPQVDKIPPLHLDLDFQDTTANYTDIRRAAGYVILPIESPAVPIDCRPANGELRPLRKLQITQILDERQADKGKLGLEIKATGVGLVGPLNDTLALDPEGFEVVQADDQGVSVAKYDEDADGIAVVSERTWLVQLRARQDRVLAPSSFRFASSRMPGAEMTYQRYQDADLASVPPEVGLEHSYQGRGLIWLWIMGLAGGAVVSIVLFVLVKVLRRRPKAATGMKLPATLNPFTVTMLLRRIQQTGKLVLTDQEALNRTIENLERRFFAESGANGEEIDLRQLTEEWMRKAQ